MLLDDLRIAASVDSADVTRGMRDAASAVERGVRDIERIGSAGAQPFDTIASSLTELAVVADALDLSDVGNVRALEEQVRTAGTALDALNADIREIGNTAAQLNTGGRVRSGDVDALRALIGEQRLLANATEGAGDQFRVLDAALRSMNDAAVTGSTGLRDVARLLTDVEGTAKRLAQMPKVGVTLASGTSDLAASRATAEEARRRADAVQRAAGQEQKARAQARAELQHEITTLGLYGRTVDAVNARAVAAWRSEAAAIRQQANELRLPRDAMLRLDVTIRQVERGFARATAQAARLRDATRFGAGGIPELTRSTGRFTEVGQRAANTALQVGFALQAMASGADTSAGRVRASLNALSALGVALGPKGLVVAGIAQSTIAIMDLFERTREEARKTRDELDRVFSDILDDTDLSPDLSGAVDKALREIRRLEVGTPGQPRRNPADAFAKGSIRDLERQIRDLETLRDRIRRGEAPEGASFFDLPRIERQIGALRTELTPLQGQLERVRSFLLNPPSPRPIRGLPAVEIAALSPEAVKRQAEKAYAAAVDVAERQLAQIEMPPLTLTQTFVPENLRRGIDLGTQLKPIALPFTASQVLIRSETDKAFAAVQRRLDTLGAAQVRLEVAQLGGDVDAIREAQADVDALGRQADSAARLLADLLAALPRDQQVEILARLAAGFGNVKRQVPTAQVRDLSRQLRTMAAGARGVAQIADAFDRIPDATRHAVEGVAGILGGIADARDLLGSLKSAGKASGVGQLFKSVEGISSVVGIIGGVASLAEGLFGTSAEERALQQQAIEATRENSRTISRLSAEVSGLALGGAAIARAQRALLDPQTLNLFVNRKDQPWDLDAALREFDLSLDALAEIARSSGITLLDDKGRLISAAFDQLQKALALTAVKLTRFDDSLSDQRDRLTLRDELAGTTDAAATVRREMELLGRLAPELAKPFAGLDGDTAEEREAIRKGLRDLFDRIDAGQLTIEELGKLTDLDELTSIIRGTNDALTELGETADDIAASLSNVPAGFKRTLDQIRFQVIEAGPRVTAAVAIAPPPASSVLPRDMVAVQTIDTEARRRIAAAEAAPAPQPIYIDKVEVNGAGVRDVDELATRLRRKVQQSARNRYGLNAPQRGSTGAGV